MLAEGSFTPLGAKTAIGVLRYRVDQVAAVVDSTHAGSTAQASVGVGGAIPVVSDVAAAAALGADSLLVGIAPQGGGLPEAWRPILADALRRGWDVIAGLHVFLADDPELAALARQTGARLFDVRRPPAGRPVAAARAARVEALVVLTVGSDCNVGKMTTALELERELAARGTRARFVATGQTGILIAGSGVAVDAVPSDFVAGVTENLVLDAARDADVVVVEGQGSLIHSGYSGVALALLHGAAPAAMVLCHELGRQRVNERDTPIPPLAELARLYEAAAAWVHPSRVVGVALNTLRHDEATARAALTAAEHETGHPATDPVRFGAAPLAVAVLERLAARRNRAALA